ncbi:NAD-dependent epimerase/dehydratase family protein [Desulfohalovibrio reitneri]|uniref:NAD-dependent epimerase/dehydratase family protein n=1 Tax=Desulfohalovibrio reitneri TaxID=1307759 RepID=UPI0004A74A89|nr:NAD-dependent epimerase/dehydratase family protein [Desulfohalovibrio reitneri]
MVLERANWLITGGCGFIGRNLIRRLLAEGEPFIRVVDNLSVGTREDLALACDFVEAAEPGQPRPGKVELVPGDILDEDLAVRAAEGMEVVVHLAANTGVAPSVENPRMDCRANVIGTLNYLEAARAGGVPRFVFASSGAPAGEVEPPIREDIPPRPVSPYGASKLAGEGYCSAYYNTFGVETVALRFSNVLGPLSGRKSSVVAKFIRKAMAGEELEIFGDGTQTRDFVYVDDLIEAILRAAYAPGVGGEVFQIATARETSILELMDVLVPELERAGITGFTVRHGEKRQGDVMRNYADTSKARRMLGWQARTDLPGAVRRTVAWFAGGNT